MNIFGFRLGGKRKEAIEKALPPELVIAIENIGCVFRSFENSETGDRRPRPLCMNFLGSRPLYIDDREKVEDWIANRYPELDDSQVKRAGMLVQDRVRLLYLEAQRTNELLGKKTSFNRYTDDFIHVKY